MASYLSLNADEAYKLGGRINGENIISRYIVTTYNSISSWATNHGLAYRNVTGFSGSTRVAAKADVYLKNSPSHTDNVLALPSASRDVTQGRYAKAGPLIGDSTGGTYENTFPFHVYPLFDDNNGWTVPNPYYTGPAVTTGEYMYIGVMNFNGTVTYGGISFRHTETQQGSVTEFGVENGFPAERDSICPTPANTVRLSNFLVIDLSGTDITSLRGKKYGFIAGLLPESVAYVATQVAYPSNTQHFHVGTGVSHGGFQTATSTSYTKVTFGGQEVTIPPQTAVERVGINNEGFMVKFKSNATANSYGYEVLPIIYTVSGTTYYAVIMVKY